MSSEPISNLDEKIDYAQLLDKYNSLERKYESVQKEKNEIEAFIQLTSPKPTIPSTQENINDVVALANEELSEKAQQMKELEKKLENSDITNIKNFSLTKLKKMKEYYTTNLQIINDAINALEK